MSGKRTKILCAACIEHLGRTYKKADTWIGKDTLSGNEFRAFRRNRHVEAAESAANVKRADDRKREAATNAQRIADGPTERTIRPRCSRKQIRAARRASTCDECGGPLTHIAEGPPSGPGSVRAVLCSDCDADSPLLEETA